jgi:hypothetical protein
MTMSKKTDSIYLTREELVNAIDYIFEGRHSASSNTLFWLCGFNKIFPGRDSPFDPQDMSKSLSLLKRIPGLKETLFRLTTDTRLPEYVREGWRQAIHEMEEEIRKI